MSNSEPPQSDDNLLLARMRQLFPQCHVTDDEIIWGEGEGPGAVIHGYRGESIMIDGWVTPGELVALAEWSRRP